MNAPVESLDNMDELLSYDEILAWACLNDRGIGAMVQASLIFGETHRGTPHACACAAYLPRYGFGRQIKTFAGHRRIDDDPRFKSPKLVHVLIQEVWHKNLPPCAPDCGLAARRSKEERANDLLVAMQAADDWPYLERHIEQMKAADAELSERNAPPLRRQVFDDDDNHRQALNHTAFFMGREVARRELHVEKAAADLLTMARSMRLTKDTAQRTITKGLQAGIDYEGRKR